MVDSELHQVPVRDPEEDARAVHRHTVYDLPEGDGPELILLAEIRRAGSVQHELRSGDPKEGPGRRRGSLA